MLYNFRQVDLQWYNAIEESVQNSGSGRFWEGIIIMHSEMYTCNDA